LIYQGDGRDKKQDEIEAQRRRQSGVRKKGKPYRREHRTSPWLIPPPESSTQSSAVLSISLPA
jgi:hypothetical protein